MIKITKSELREKMIELMELGLTNSEIAERLNSEYGATEENALSTMKVAQLKDAVGLKGYKPKKKALFELVDDNVEIPAPKVEMHVSYLDKEMGEENLIAEDEFLNSEEAESLAESFVSADKWD